MATKHFCDRCSDELGAKAWRIAGAEWASGSTGYAIEFENRFPGLHPDTVVELCGECESRVKAFLVNRAAEVC